MIASTVSSKMLSAAADREGFTFEETLPGFKWMAHRGQELKVVLASSLLGRLCFVTFRHRIVDLLSFLLY